MLKRLYTKFQQFIDYFLFGLITAVLAIGIFYVMNVWVGLQYLLANIISVITAILFSYTVNKRYVFKTKTRTWKQSLREFGLFVSVKMSGSLLNMLGLFVFVQFLNMNPTWAKIVLELTIASLSYLISRNLIFKKITELEGRDE
ncbi:GtrA family protein [Alkalibacterium kapii]|uniref:GtrA/DPMS transmembrane domain-containing protein n=1 Tax=Alkalibacterium kapii TaxID=426704 RepID=A0A511AY93_9LACT|nr:GtrA family protein [Alkalibacterium kapii]GEK90577.1 hypothetical protein AKA01nite_01990 [Alkalibacterium kapii]